MTKKKTLRDLRKFGLIMAVPLAALAALAFWRGKPAWPYLGGLALLFLLLGLVLPAALRPVEWAWMKFAKAMGTVMTYVILVLAFFLVITPVGLAMRLFGRRPVHVGFDERLSTYWTPVEENGIYDRAEKPY